MVQLAVDTTTGEVWKRLEEFPDYWVSSFGKILSRRKIPEKVLVQPKNKEGYGTIILYDGFDRPHHFLSHRVIARGFLGASDMEINHKDKDRFNNRIENLEYVTRSENCRHREYGKKRFVTFHKGMGKYQVQISKLSPRTRGYYETKEEAFAAAHSEYVKYFNKEPWRIG